MGMRRTFVQLRECGIETLLHTVVWSWANDGSSCSEQTVEQRGSVNTEQACKNRNRRPVPQNPPHPLQVFVYRLYNTWQAVWFNSL